MMQVTCATCAFYSPAQNTWARGSGQCRRHAPLLDAALEKPRTIWPLVRDDNWCGEHAIWVDE